jgi:hypothetical protein
LRQVTRKQQALEPAAGGRPAAGPAEVAVTLHPDLSALHRRKVEELRYTLSILRSATRRWICCAA